ncbi:MAG: spermidine/putrescine transport system substrate-binding protein [Verrucomicrobiota bacterium]|jgi:spermidine/putrescine-binding protein
MQQIVQELYQDIKAKGISAGAFLVAGVVLILFAIFALTTSALPQDWKGKLWWLPFVFAITGLLFVIVAPLVAWVIERNRTALQLIAWTGFNEPEVTLPFVRTQKSNIDVLEYVRGIEKVTQLKYCGSLFDVIISDVEFLDRHEKGHRLRSLTGVKYEGPLWEKVNESLATEVQTAAGGKFGVPVRFGLNDIVINSSKTHELFGKQTISSYKELKLSEVLSNTSVDCRVGLWNWYVTTFPILLLAEGVPLKDIWFQPESTIIALKNTILANKEKFYLFDYPEDATKSLRQGKVWTILGSGGWILPRQVEHRQGLQAIMPTEGAIMWVECAGIIHNDEKTVELSRSFIEYLLNKETQTLLAERESYRACPTTQEALDSLPHDLCQLFHKDRVFDDKRTLNSRNVILRQLPKDWRVWEKHWEEIDATLTHA